MGNSDVCIMYLLDSGTAINQISIILSVDYKEIDGSIIDHSIMQMEMPNHAKAGNAQSCADERDLEYVCKRNINKDENRKSVLI